MSFINPPNQGRSPGDLKGVDHSENEPRLYDQGDAQVFQEPIEYEEEYQENPMDGIIIPEVEEKKENLKRHGLQKPVKVNFASHMSKDKKKRFSKGTDGNWRYQENFAEKFCRKFLIGLIVLLMNVVLIIGLTCFLVYVACHNWLYLILFTSSALFISINVFCILTPLMIGFFERNKRRSQIVFDRVSQKMIIEVKTVLPMKITRTEIEFAEIFDFSVSQKGRWQKVVCEMKCEVQSLRQEVVMCGMRYPGGLETCQIFKDILLESIEKSEVV